MDLIAGVNSQKDFQLPHFGTRTCSGKTPALYVEVVECLLTQTGYSNITAPTELQQAEEHVRAFDENCCYIINIQSLIQDFSAADQRHSLGHMTRVTIYNKMTRFLVTLGADRADQLA